MRLDLRIEIFPKARAASPQQLCVLSVSSLHVAVCCAVQDVTVFDDDNTIWAYAIPHRQWIAMPDRQYFHQPSEHDVTRGDT